MGQTLAGHTSGSWTAALDEAGPRSPHRGDRSRRGADTGSICQDFVQTSCWPPGAHSSPRPGWGLCRHS